MPSRFVSVQSAFSASSTYAEAPSIGVPCSSTTSTTKVWITSPQIEGPDVGGLQRLHSTFALVDQHAALERDAHAVLAGVAERSWKSPESSYSH
jgi:hypothetical protein